MMDDILAYLEKLTHPETRSPVYFELAKVMGPLTDQIRDALSLEFLDRLNYAQADIDNFLCQECFSRGFRLGAQIILALSGPSAPGIHHKS